MLAEALSDEPDWADTLSVEEIELPLSSNQTAGCLKPLGLLLRFRLWDIDIRLLGERPRFGRHRVRQLSRGGARG
jgi:hypothetical protein